MIAAPATYGDWCDLLAARGQRYALPSDVAMLRQVTTGPAWALRRAAGIPPAALAGIVHADHSVIWIATAPEASISTLPLVRVLRALADDQQAAAGRPLWANVADENAAGQRLVALLGFEQVAPHTWRRAYEQGCEVDQQVSRCRAGAGRGARQPGAAGATDRSS